MPKLRQRYGYRPTPDERATYRLLVRLQNAANKASRAGDFARAQGLYMEVEKQASALGKRAINTIMAERRAKDRRGRK